MCKKNWATLQSVNLHIMTQPFSQCLCVSVPVFCISGTHRAHVFLFVCLMSVCRLVTLVAGGCFCLVQVTWAFWVTGSANPSTHNGSQQDPLSHPFSTARGNNIWRMRPLSILHGIYKSLNAQLEFLSLMDDFRLFRWSPFCNVSSLLSFSSCQRKVVSYFTVTSKGVAQRLNVSWEGAVLCGSKCIEEGDLCRRVWVFLC